MYKVLSQACAVGSLASCPTNVCLEIDREQDARQSSSGSGYGSAHLTGSKTNDSHNRTENSPSACIVGEKKKEQRVRCP